MAYSTEENVYEATGMNSAVVQSLTDKTPEQVETLINDYIAKADDRLKRLMKIPISIRKEKHEFDGRNFTIELGPDQDEFEIFDYDPENCVETIYALYAINKKRIKLPYPKDCDELTEGIDDYTSWDCALSKETTTFKCGTASIKAVFASDSGYFGFPANANLNKNIYPWTYIGFWFRTNDASATFTLKLYDKDGKPNEWSFTVDKANVWYIISVKRAEFDVEAVDWGTKGVKLQQIRLYTDASSYPLEVYFDNFNFNDGFFWTYPEGLICWAKDQDTMYPTETIYVTYSYDPYKVSGTVPEVVEQASAKLAGVYLLDYLIGIRIRTVGFEQMSESLEFDADREVLVAQRNELRREAAGLLATIGYGTPQGIS